MHTQILSGIVLFQEDIPTSKNVTLVAQKEGSMESITRTACSSAYNKFKDALFVDYGLSMNQV